MNVFCANLLEQTAKRFIKQSFVRPYRPRAATPEPAEEKERTGTATAPQVANAEII